MVLIWWKIWCPIHLHACGSPWWMVSFPYWLLILSLFFRASLDPKKNQTLKPIRAWCSLLQGSVRSLFFKYKFMGYPILYAWINLITYYHNISSVKLPHEIDFFAHIPVYDYPIREKDVKHLSLSKQKWEYSIEVIQGLLYSWRTLPWPC